MKKVALISGILGQDAAYLSKLLLEKGYKVVGFHRKTTKPDFSNLKYLCIEKKVELMQADMTDQASLNHLVKLVQPNEIYHLAAQSHVGASFDIPEITSEINALGTLYLLEAMRMHAPKARFYNAATSELFGDSFNPDGTQNEKTPFAPKSPYAVAKLFAYHMTKVYRESYGLFACSGILMNHESELRGEDFVTRKISNAVARIHLHKQDVLELGNIDSARDWGHSEDFVEAMYLMLQQPKPKDYVICTGKTHTIKDFLDAAFDVVGIKDWSRYVISTASNKRPNDVTKLKGDYSLANDELGWEPKVTFTQLVRRMVEADIKRNLSVVRNE